MWFEFWQFQMKPKSISKHSTLGRNQRSFEVLIFWNNSFLDTEANLLGIFKEIITIVYHREYRLLSIWLQFCSNHFS